MASIVRRVRKLFGRVRKYSINTDKKKDVIPYDDGDKMVQLTGYRNLSDSFTELTSHTDPQNENLVEIIPNGKPHSYSPNDGTVSVKSNNTEENSNDESKEHIEDSIEPLSDIETRQCNEALESPKNSHDNDKIEIIRDNIDWSGLDDMKEEFKKKYSRYLVKKQNFDEKNCSPIQDTSKQENTSAIMMEKECQVSPKSAHSKKSPNNEELIDTDTVPEECNEDLLVEPFGIVKNLLGHVVKPDVLLKVDEKHQFLLHREMLITHSAKFNERLIVRKKTLQSFWVLQVDPEYVDPKVLKCILNFFYEYEPLPCRHFSEIINAAYYLDMDRLIIKLQLIMKNRIPILTNSVLQNALLKYVMAFEMRSLLEKSQVIYTHHSNNIHVTVKGQKGDLTEEDLARLCDFEYIKIQTERSVMSLDNLRGNTFEQVAIRPHVVVHVADSITLWVFNVFKSNIEEALFIADETWMSSLVTSLQLSAEYLSQHYPELLLKNAHLQLNEDQLDYIRRQDGVEFGRKVLTQIQNPNRLLQLLEEHKNMHVLKLESKSGCEY